MRTKILVSIAVVLLLSTQVMFSFTTGMQKDPYSRDIDDSGRATLETWTDTDWSGGKVNITNDVEMDLTPGEAVLRSDICQAVPFIAPSPDTTKMTSMVEFQGRIMVSRSHSSPADGTDIYSCDPLSNSCTLLTTLSEELVYRMTVNENGTRLLIPGGKQLNPAFNGSVYSYDGTVFTRYDVKDGSTRSTRVYGVLEYGSKLYATSTDNDNRAYVYRSIDEGKTWTKVFNMVARPYQRGLYAMGRSGNTIFVQTDGLATEGAKVLRYNGTGWVSDVIPGTTTNYGAFASSGGDPYMFVGTYLYTNTNNRWVEVPSPTSPTIPRSELYSIDMDTFTNTSDMYQSRFGHTSDLTLGSVVTAGGMVGQHLLDMVELYDATTGNVTTAKSMGISRGFHASSVLNDGTIIVIGGQTGLPPVYSATASVERYNLSRNLWSVSSSMTVARYNHTATKLNDGRVLVTGGRSGPSAVLASAEIFNPVANTWTPVASMHTARANHTAVLLQNGSVFISGGGDNTGGPLNSVEIYDPAANKWNVVPVMPWSAFGLAASLMDNGNIMVSGGMGSAVSSVYSTSTNTWGPTINLDMVRSFHTSTALPGGRVLILGGYIGSASVHFLNNGQIYTTATGTWTATTDNMNTGRAYHRTVVLNSTTILMTGGIHWVPDVATTILGTKSLTSYGTDKLVVAESDRKFNVRDADGNWASCDGIGNGQATSDLLVVHGRLYYLLTNDSTIYVAMPVPSGTYASVPHNFGGYILNATISWNALLPTNTDIKFQVRSARSKAGLMDEEFLGPDGTNNTFFTSSGTNIGAIHKGNNWAQYKAYLSTTGQNLTPVLQDVSIQANVEPLMLKKLVVTPPEITITADEMVDFNVTGYDQFGIPMTFAPIWSTTGGSIDAMTGNYTPKLIGTWKVSAKVNTVEGTANVTVTPGRLSNIKITPDRWIGTTDETRVFSAEGKDAKGNIVQFTPVWGISGGGQISQIGNFSPNLPGIWKVYANDTDTGCSGNATALISLGNPYTVSISPTNVNLDAGKKQKFTATVYDSDGNVLDYPVDWRTNGGGTITSNGEYSALRMGNWKVFANLSQYGRSVSADVKVIPGPLATIQVSPGEATVSAGKSVNFTVKTMDAFGNNLDVMVTWTALGGGEINNGQYTPTKTGLWTIYANASGLSGIVQVRVLPGPIAKITVTPAVLDTKTNNWSLFQAKAEDKYGNPIQNLNFIWEASEGLGTLDATGGFTAGTKTISGTVTARATFGNATVSGTAVVNVKKSKTTNDGPPPAYYTYLEYAIIGTMIAVVALIMTELSRSGDEKGKTKR